MFCVRSSVAGFSALRNAIPAVTPGAGHVRSGSHAAKRPNYPMGQTATPSLHNDLPPAVFDDFDRKANWRTKTDRRKRKGANDLSSYMVMSAGAAVTVYMAKYALYGTVMMVGPSRDKYAAGSVEIDISTIPEGKNAVFTFRGKPLFIRHRTQEEIDAAKTQDVGSLRDPQTDEERCKNEKYLICIGICTHLGCVPIAHAGSWKGYFCPCHGSHYDTCARIMKGPAPLNLEVPEHEYLEDSLVLIGK